MICCKPDKTNSPPPPAPLTQAPVEENPSIHFVFNRETHYWNLLHGDIKTNKYEGVDKFYQLHAWWKSILKVHELYINSQNLSEADKNLLTNLSKTKFDQREKVLSELNTISLDDRLTILPVSLLGLPPDKLNLATLMLNDIKSKLKEIEIKYEALTVGDLQRKINLFSRIDFLAESQSQVYEFYPKIDCDNKQANTPILSLTGPLSFTKCNKATSMGLGTKSTLSLKVGGACINTIRKLNDLCHSLMVYNDLQGNNYHSVTEALSSLSEVTLHSFYKNSSCSKKELLIRSLNIKAAQCKTIDFILTELNENNPQRVMGYFNSDNYHDKQNSCSIPEVNFKNICEQHSANDANLGDFVFSNGYELNEASHHISKPTSDYMKLLNRLGTPPGYPFSNPHIFGISYEDGELTDRNATLVEDPTNPGNMVLKYWLKNATIDAGNNRKKIRIQTDVNFIEKQKVTELYSKQRVYFNKDLSKLVSYPDMNDWWIGITIGEFWIGDFGAADLARISVHLSPVQNYGLIFSVSVQNMADLGNGVMIWENYSTYKVPTEEWITIEMGYKMGNDKTGRFIMTAQSKNDPAPVEIINVTNWTYSNKPYVTEPIPLWRWNAQKVYTSDNVMNWIRGTDPKNEKFIEVLWDDFQFSTKLPNRAPFK
ncbi:MAG: hypothetical protein HON90_06400 [Halobacteriovoraceae bacterium]|nr:hypothetical protein [Halobacteriovoraceae bacterium]